MSPPGGAVSDHGTVHLYYYILSGGIMLEPYAEGEEIMAPEGAGHVLTETAQTVLKRRYYLKDPDGNPVEDWEQLCRRVGDAVAAGKKQAEKL